AKANEDASRMSDPTPSPLSAAAGIKLDSPASGGGGMAPVTSSPNKPLVNGDRKPGDDAAGVGGLGGGCGGNGPLMMMTTTTAMSTSAPPGLIPNGFKTNGVQKQAVVKPNVLTHVIDGFVILEGPEPFSDFKTKKENDDLKKDGFNTSTLSGAVKRRFSDDSGDESLSKKFDGRSELSGDERKSSPGRGMSPGSGFGSGDDQPSGKMASRKNPQRCEMCGKTDFKRKPGRPAARKFCSPACAKKSCAEISSNQALGARLDGSMPMEEDGDPVPELQLVHADVTSVGTDGLQLDAALGSPKSDGPLSPRPAVARWSVTEVRDWVKGIGGCSEYAEDFFLQEIDGQALLLLKADHLMQAMSMKLGPALKICAKITQLRALEGGNGAAPSTPATPNAPGPMSPRSGEQMVN
ncbi:unnamed protein product, partial [Notodromas monacha]